MLAFSRFLPGVFGLTLLASVGLGCASDEAARMDDEETRRAWNDPKTHIRAATNDETDASPEMAVSGDEGTLNSADIEGAMARHRDELLDCYSLRRGASRSGANRALLRFFVDGKGEVVDVAILESNIGNGRVERCLADIAVGVRLPPPNGRKPTTFDYPIEFRVASRSTAKHGRR
jgi:hypothetical protein